MASYVVMRPGSGEDCSERTAFIRDGFSIIAFLVPLIWCIWYRLWAEAILVVVAGLLIGAAGELAVLPEVAIILLSLLVNLLVGLEGQARRIARLRRKGFRQEAVIWAAGIEEAEARHFGDGSSLRDRGKQHHAADPEDAAMATLVRAGDHGLVGMVGHRGAH